MERVEFALGIAEAQGLPEVLSQALNTKALVIDERPHESLAERRERWQAMFDYLLHNDVIAWRTRYLDALTSDAARAAA